MRNCLIRFGLTLVAMAGVLGNGAGCTTGTPDAPADPALVEAGRLLYSQPHLTDGGGEYSCAECHGADGSGGDAPSLRGEEADHLQSHAQGGGGHPAGILYPDLTTDDFRAIAAFLGAEGGGEHNDNEAPVDTLPGDAERGHELFTTPQPTTGVGPISCANCHASDGSSGFGPDIRGEEADHLEAHAQGGGRHPAGVKFPELTAQDFADMAAYLAGEGGTDHSTNGADDHDHKDGRLNRR